MKNKTAKRPAGTKTLAKANPINIPLGVVVLAYILIPTYTPNLTTFDTNAPKFLALSLMNLVGFITLFTQRNIRRQPGAMALFFKTGPGIAYAGFLAASLLSFFNALNLTESLFQFTKVFTVFSATYILSVILMHDPRYLTWIVLVFTGMLIYDSITVFYHIHEFIQGKIKSVLDIKTIYSNKNILASAIFVKLPFALWLMLFSKKWLKALGWIGLVVGVAAVFFMATRAFYLGLIVLSVVVLAYLLIVYLRGKQKKYLWMAGAYVLALGISYLAFSGTRELLYPKNKESRYTQGVGEQLATIGTFEGSSSKRINAWKWSWHMLKEKPLFGVGSGNWKVVELKYENQKSDDFIYMYKAHNDFIETAAETGFIGGLCFLAIFALIAWAFLKMFFSSRDDRDDLFRWLFLAASGIAFYSVDAFFNFPADRPEILLLFAFFVATGITVIAQLKRRGADPAPEAAPGKMQHGLLWSLSGVAILALIASSYVFYLNFKSSRIQRIAYQEIKGGKLKTPADKIVNGFTPIPSIVGFAETQSNVKARYLLNEGRNEEAIALLKADQASPWDGRREYFLSMGFNKLEQPDSVLFYAERMYDLKPNHLKNINVMVNLLDKKKEYDRILSYLDTYLADHPKESKVWVNSTYYYYKRGEVDKAWERIEEAKKQFPKDSLVNKQHNFIYDKKFVEPFREDYNKAVAEFNKKNYGAALPYLNRFLGNVPDHTNAMEFRAFTHYYLKNYLKCIEDIDRLLTLTDKAGLFNLRGICYRALNKMEDACRDFETAMKKGNPAGKSNYERFCKAKKPQ